uniref:UBZ4-type domain-containing protein n=1 Tax=Oryzias sinensis TaxID=183150 RepID=A0A8C7WYZ8_9TELE
GLMLRGGRTTEEHPDQEEEQMDADVCPGPSLFLCPEVFLKPEEPPTGSAQTVDRGPASPGGVEVKDPGDPSSEAAEVPGSPPTSVDCPICQLSFPASDIEMHAAFCNGGVAEDGTSLPGFQAEAAETSQTLEKCFICQSAIPLREYSRHTELCIRPRRSKPAAVSRLARLLLFSASIFNSSSPNPQKGNLLSALQDTESRSAGEAFILKVPSSSLHQQGCDRVCEAVMLPCGQRSYAGFCMFMLCSIKLKEKKKKCGQRSKRRAGGSPASNFY